MIDHRRLGHVLIKFKDDDNIWCHHYVKYPIYDRRENVDDIIRFYCEVKNLPSPVVIVEDETGRKCHRVIK